MRGMRACADPKFRKEEVYSPSPQRAKGKGGSVAYAASFAHSMTLIADSNVKPQTQSLRARHVCQMLDHCANRMLRIVDAKVSVLMRGVEAAHECWPIPVGEMAGILFRVL